MSTKKQDLSLAENEHIVAQEDELADGDRIVVLLNGREVGVFNVNGEYKAYTNWCAHQGGPLCEGPVTGTVEADFDRDSLEVELDWCRDGEVLNCPWHGWEYDITSGQCLSDSDVKLRSFPVRVEQGNVIVST
ncbi:Rieske (2Fe-2S) protein [Natronorubrum sp. FCH18a]|uniref:Rieske (2Fe-2S) protein n=1 Tax=Natronorubrum sp. FCH18a TaxID=3447018 RepID=UPI003F517BF6